MTGVDEASLLSMDRPSTGSRQYLQAVTAAAGGFAVVDVAGFDAGMTRLLTEFDHYYRPDSRRRTSARRAGGRWRCG